MLGNSTKLFEFTSCLKDHAHTVLVVSVHILKLLFFKCLFIFDCAGSSVLLRLFSSCREQGLLSSCSARPSHCGGFILLQSSGSRVHKLPYLQLTGSSAQATQLWCISSVALWQLGSPRIKDRTCVSYTGRQTPPLIQGSPGYYFFKSALWPKEYNKLLTFKIFQNFFIGMLFLFVHAFFFSSVCNIYMFTNIIYASVSSASSALQHLHKYFANRYSFQNYCFS